MEKKFTQGEWEVVHELNVSTENRSICTCGFNSSDEKEMVRSKWNAKLISAAPDLLNALEKMCEWHEKMATWDKGDNGYYAAKKAIKKALE